MRLLHAAKQECTVVRGQTPEGEALLLADLKQWVSPTMVKLVDLEFYKYLLRITQILTMDSTAQKIKMEPLF